MRILGFTTASGIVTGVFCGVAPAWRATCEDPKALLQQNARTLAEGTSILGKGLIVTQVALSFVLLARAGLFVRSLHKLRTVEPGFRTRGVIELHLFPKPGGYKNLNQVSYYHELTDRVAKIPGVASAGLLHASLGSIHEWTEKVRIHNTAVADVHTDFEMVMPGFFHTIGIDLLRGRSFTWKDDDHAPRVAIVSKNFVEKFFPGSDAIGQRLDVTTMPKWQDLQIVGIVSDASLYDIRKHQPLTVYVPSMQYGTYMGWSEMLVQTEVPPVAIAGALRQTVESLGRESVPWVKTAEENINRSILHERVTAMLSAFFRGLALLLAAIGLYGLMAYNVTRRAREIGIHMALRAPRRAVQRMVLRETLALVIAGLAIGLPSAMAGSHLIAHMLYGIGRNDPFTLLAVSLVLLAAAMLASFLPARRAMRVDPMDALRYE